MAAKLRGNITMDMVNAGIAKRNSFNPKIGKTTTTTTQPPQATPQATLSSIGDSYTKMIGQYEPDISKFTGMFPSTNQFTEKPDASGFYSSMSGLEGASMRLANAASQRAMAEAGYGSGLKKGEMGTEYGLRGELAGVESGYRQKEMGTEYGLKGGLAEKEYGLKGGLTAKEYGLKSKLEKNLADIEARKSGYSGLSDLQRPMQRKRLY